MLKAVVFDLDNTLYDYDAAHAPAFAAITEYARAALSVPPERFPGLHRAAERELAARCGRNCAAVHNRLIRYQVLLEQLGAPIDHAPVMARLYWSTLLDALRPLPGAPETLKKLREAGLAVGVGTNMTADYQYEKLCRLGLMTLVDFVVTSEEVTAEKPDPRLFDWCARKAGCAPGDCAFVGDSLENDVRGALAAGMRAIWLCPTGDAAKAPTGAATIRALPELIPLLAGY